ncbi:MAG: hypothetical protein AMJ90_02935 [candidate division Zixibacteria bacterium SM23_73_2]|nr:MAG: hypothetical protein AMJ90_02935 [candidate division Zixibacteria bacterium SM23_73_2]
MGKKLKKEYRFYRRKPEREKESGFYGILIILLAIFVFVYGFSFVKRVGQKEKNSNIEPRGVRVQVIDGSGTHGACGDVSSFLKERKTKNFIFYVVDKFDLPDSLVTRTILLDRGGKPKLMGEIADFLGIQKKRVIYKPLKDNYRDLDFTLVLGADVENILEKWKRK